MIVTHQNRNRCLWKWGYCALLSNLGLPFFFFIVFTQQCSSALPVTQYRPAQPWIKYGSPAVEVMLQGSRFSPSDRPAELPAVQLKVILFYVLIISFSPACAVRRLCKTNFFPALKTTTGKVTTNWVQRRKSHQFPSGKEWFLSGGYKWKLNVCDTVHTCSHLP